MKIQVEDKIRLIKFEKDKNWKYENGDINYPCSYYSEEVGTVMFVDEDGAFRVTGFRYITWACKEMVEIVPENDSISYLLRRKACLKQEMW